MKTSTDSDAASQELFLACSVYSNPEHLLKDICLSLDKRTFLLRIFRNCISIFHVRPDDSDPLDFLKQLPLAEPVLEAKNFQPGEILLRLQSGNCSLVSLDPMTLELKTLWLANLRRLSRGRGLEHGMVSLFRRPEGLKAKVDFSACPFGQLLLARNDNSVFNVYLFDSGRPAVAHSEPIRNSMLGLYRQKGLSWAKIQRRFREEKCIWLENNIRDFRIEGKVDFSVSFDLGFDGLGRILRARLTWSGWRGQAEGAEQGFYCDVAEGTGLQWGRSQLGDQWSGQLPSLWLLIQRPCAGFVKGHLHLDRFERSICQIPLNLQTVAGGPKLGQKLEQFEIKSQLGASLEVYMRVKNFVQDFWVIGGGRCFLVQMTSEDLCIFTRDQYVFILQDAADKEVFQIKFGASQNRLFALKEFFPEDSQKKAPSCLSRTNRRIGGGRRGGEGTPKTHRKKPRRGHGLGERVHSGGRSEQGRQR